MTAPGFELSEKVSQHFKADFKIFEATSVLLLKEIVEHLGLG